MGWYYGSIPLFVYPFSDEVPPPPTGFFLLTDLTNFLLSDNTPLETAGP